MNHETRSQAPASKPLALAGPSSWQVALADRLGSVASVRHVLAEHAGDHVTVWIAVDDADSFEARSLIYDREAVVMNLFSDVAVDFNLVSACGRSPEQIASGAEIIFSRS